MRKWVIIAAVFGLGAMVGMPVFGSGVVKTTTNTPTSFETDWESSSIGVSFRGQGPGALATVNSAITALGSDSLTHSGTGSREVYYDHTETGHSHWRFVSAVVVGFQSVYAGRGSLWTLEGTATLSNTLSYTLTKSDDGAIVVVASDDATITATADESQSSDSDFNTVFDFYGALINFSTSASLTAEVTSTNDATAAPLSWGAATGTIYGYVLGS